MKTAYQLRKRLSVVMFSISLFVIPNGAFAQTTASFEEPSVMCNMDTLTFQNTSTIDSSDTVTFKWNFGSGQDEVIQTSKMNGRVIWIYPGHKIVSLTAYSANGDSSVYTQTILVNGTPQAYFSQGNICNLTSAIFAPYSTGNEPELDYKWDFNGEATSDQKQTDYYFSSTGSKTVSLVVSNPANGCSDSMSLTLDVLVQPIADFEVEDICCGETVSLINKSVVSAGDLTYNWEFLDYDTTMTPCENVGEQRVLLTAIADNGCWDKVTKTYNIFPLADASFIFKNEHQSRIVEFDAIDSTNDKYTWTFGNGDRSTEMDPIYEYEWVDKGTFEVCLTVRKDACLNQNCEDLTIDVTTGLYRVEDFGFSIYPNPSTGLFTIDNENGEEYKLQVFDILGNELNFIQISNGIDLQGLEDGIYILQLKGENYTVSKKVILRR